MDFVTPWLAIGAASEAADAGLRRQHGIDAVLSLLPVDFDAGEAHLTLPVADRVALPATAIATVLSFIERQRIAGRKTLLHCQMGISRSPALAVCYLHEHAGRPLADALAEVRRLRPLADPHAELLASIAAYYGVPLCPAIPLNATPPAATETTLDLSANENPLGPSPLALDALQSALRHSHRYPDRRGDALRQALARQLGGTAEQVVLGNGSCELLDLAALAFLAPGDSAIVAPPCFPAYRSATRRARGRLIEVPLRAEDDFAYHLDQIAAAVDDTTRLIYLGNPNNPTGRGVTAAALNDLLARLPARVVVLLDEAYRDFTHDDADDSLADGPQLVRNGARLLVVRSFSKLHGLAGLRIGYAFGPAELIAALEALRPTYNTNASAQTAALAALADRAHQAVSRRLVADGGAMLSEGLNGLGLHCPPSLGNFVLARLDAERFSISAATVLDQLAAAGILLKPGAAFGLPDYLRISVGLPSENRRLLDTLAKILASARTSTNDQHIQGS